MIAKTRYLRDYEGYVWEIDVFAGQNAGLIVAEVELSSPQEKPPLPPWVGAEVTADSRYFNNSLYYIPLLRMGYRHRLMVSRSPLPVLPRPGIQNWGKRVTGLQKSFSLPCLGTSAAAMCA